MRPISLLRGKIIGLTCKLKALPSPVKAKYNPEEPQDSGSCSAVQGLGLRGAGSVFICSDVKDWGEDVG